MVIAGATMAIRVFEPGIVWESRDLRDGWVVCQDSEGVWQVGLLRDGHFTRGVNVTVQASETVDQRKQRCVKVAETLERIYTGQGEVTD